MKEGQKALQIYLNVSLWGVQSIFPVSVLSVLDVHNFCFRCIKSLLKFSVIIRQDLMSCIAMVGVDLDTCVPGKSDRVDKVWEQLRQQLLASA